MIFSARQDAIAKASLRINPDLPRRFGGPNGYGHLAPGSNPMRTSILRLAVRLGMVAHGRGSGLRECVLDPRGCGILNQISTSSCTGHAEVLALTTRLVKMGTPPPYRLSPVSAYKFGLMIDRQPNEDGSLPTLKDEGAIPDDVTRGTTEFGIASYDMCPTDPATVTNEPTLLEVESATMFPARGIYGVHATGTERARQLRLGLDTGRPFKLAAYVDAPFEDWRGGDPCPPPQMDRILGAHALTLLDYDLWDSGRKVEWLLGNSWGTDAGEGGFWRVSDEWMQQAMDFECVEVEQRS